MQLSKYIKIFPYRDKPGYLLLFSTKKASTILINKSLLKSIEDGTLSISNQETLYKLGFIVPDVLEEKREMCSILDEANTRIKKFNAIVVMNLDCNLACRYCYEGKMKGKHYLSSETQNILIDYIESHPLSAEKAVHIDFYGGEPLLSLEKIINISNKLKVLAEQRGLSYSFNLITNGTLLNSKIAEELGSLGLKNARITIDGPKENHNYYRPFKSGEETFDVIIKNIKEAVSFINIQLGGNFTRKNYRQFPLLLDFLLNKGITQDKISIVKFDPVTQTGGEFGLPDFTEGTKSINEPWLCEASLFLREEILKRGFNTNKIMPTSCMIQLKDDIVVHFDGTVYKCPGFIGWKGLAVGDLKNGIMDYRESHHLDIWKTEKCLDCEYLPLCFGGCRYMKFLKEGHMSSINCRKPFLDSTLEDFIKQEIVYNLKIDNSFTSMTNLNSNSNFDNCVTKSGARA